MDISQILYDLGEDRSLHQGAVNPPIYQTTNFCSPTVSAMRETLKNEQENPFYTRGNNPTVEIIRKKVAALEGADDALFFGSGSAAMAAGILSQVGQGDHVVCVQKPYSWTHKLLTIMLPRFGVESTFIDGTVVQNWQDAIQPNTKLFVLESPNSMTFEQQDIRAVAKIAREKGITTLLDNSYCTPLYQRPIEMGIDIVCHSGSKYLAGHSDVVAGVLCGSKEMVAKIFKGEFMTLGGIISPNDAWLILRGLRTLPIRMERHAISTPKVVSFLEEHPKVEKVYYPFSTNNPQYELTRKQIAMPTGQFSIELKAKDLSEVERFCDNLNYFLLACSWGGYESLAFPIAALYDSDNYGTTTLPWNFIRFFVGLESPEALIQDLSQALDKM